LFRIKICGITTLADGEAAFLAGADAVGLNFYVRSLRCITADQAVAISSGLPKGISRVGVFVNQSADEIESVLTQCPLDYVQLHGNENISLLELLPNVAIVKGLRLTLGDSIEIIDQANKWLAAGAHAVLLDSPQLPGEFGGSGTIGNWVQAEEANRMIKGKVVLAGGLNPDNVGDAIVRVGPWGVDCASGVETFPGKKSAELVLQFVAAARSAFKVNPTRWH
jgi:phosphoribosylanthranilate isomerase